MGSKDENTHSTEVGTETQGRQAGTRDGSILYRSRSKHLQPSHTRPITLLPCPPFGVPHKGQGCCPRRDSRGGPMGFKPGL